MGTVPYFTWHTKIPIFREKDVTYDQICCNYKSQKVKPNRTRLVAGVSLISFPGYFSTITADITTEKLLFNRRISTKGARILCCDIKKFYLGTPIYIYEYILLLLKLTPE